MADTTMRPERPPEPRRIAVTNTSRNHPILFHFVGGSLRLGPLETRVIDQRCLASPELSHLVGTGAVKVSDAPMSRRHEPAAPATEASGAPAARPRSSGDPREA